MALIKCNYRDGKDARVFQEQTKLFGNKRIETIIGLQIQGTHAISKCSAVSVQHQIKQYHDKYLYPKIRKKLKFLILNHSKKLTLIMYIYLFCFTSHISLLVVGTRM